MTILIEDDSDPLESEITLRECCQSGCTVCVLDYQPTIECSDIQPQIAQTDLLEAIQKACLLVDDMALNDRED